MEISFYVLLTLACLVLVLAMWACAASSTPKWGPDLTLELPPHILQQALFRTVTPSASKANFTITAANRPSEKPWEPLLRNEHPTAIDNPPTKCCRSPVIMNMDAAVKVLPARYVPIHKTRSTFSTFNTDEPA